MQTAFHSGYIIILYFLTLIAAGCGTVPVEKKLSTAELIQQDNAHGTELAHGLESELSVVRNPEITLYLQRVAQSLVDSTAELSGAKAKVQIVADKDGRWRNYGLPGDRIYLSVGMLRQVEYENELAASIAFELAHVLKRHVAERLRRSGILPKPENSSMEGLIPANPEVVGEKVEYFGPSGIFSFNEDAQLDAAEAAVGILYRAGFDSRGLVSLFTLLQGRAENSPYESSTLAKLIERTRRAIALYSPLRNPIVRSQAFIAVQKRIKRL